MSVRAHPSPHVEKALEEDVSMAIPNKYHVLWLNNIKAMYSHMNAKILTDQSLTMAWLPGGRVVLGNFLNAASRESGVKHVVFITDSKSSGGPLWSYETGMEVNRVRVFSRNDNSYFAILIADGRVLLFDASNLDKQPLMLADHGEGGFALAWSNDGLLASGSDNGEMQVWKIDFKNWSADQLAKAHTGRVSEGKGVNDLAWSGNLLCVACDDGKIMLYDASLTRKRRITSEHEKVDCITVNPLDPEYIATAGSEYSVAIWKLDDLLYNASPVKPVAVLTGHDGNLYSLQFSPHTNGLLASASDGAGDGGRVFIWDVLKAVNTEEDPSKRETFRERPELIFIHGGHKLTVNDVAWHPTLKNCVGSTDEDGLLHVWYPKPFSKFASSLLL